MPSDTATVVSAIKREVLATGNPGRFDVSFDSAYGRHWYEGRVEPRIVDGEVVGVLTVAIDITRHKQHEREIRDMLRELTHRSKNLLSVVQSIAHQSRIGVTDIDAFVGPFAARLLALSVIHELLVDNDWRGALIGDIIRRVRARTPGGAQRRLPGGGPRRGADAGAVAEISPSPCMSFSSMPSARDPAGRGLPSSGSMCRAAVSK